MGCLVKSLVIVLLLLLLLGLAVFFFLQLPRFGALPEGERLARVQSSPHYHHGEFHNAVQGGNLPLPEHLREQKGKQPKFYQSVWSALFGAEDPAARPQRALPVVETDLAALPRERDCLVWFGHSSYLLQLAGKRLLVDPVFGTASPLPGINRPFLGTEDFYTPERMPEVDVLLITHDHYDHLDADTVEALKGRVGIVICPLGVGAHLERWGYPPEGIRELDWGDVAELPGLRVRAHTALHYSGRDMRRRRVLWASYVVQGNGRTLYLGGDSGYASHFAAIGRQYGGIDYAVMENGQYNVAWATNHMLPHELPQAIRDLRARRVLTVHHSKYKISPHPWKEPLENAYSLHENGFCVDIPRLGEPVYLDAPPVVSPWWRSE